MSGCRNRKTHTLLDPCCDQSGSQLDCVGASLEMDGQRRDLAALRDDGRILRKNIDSPGSVFLLEGQSSRIVLLRNPLAV